MANRCCLRANSSKTTDFENGIRYEPPADVPRCELGTHYEATSWINLDFCGLVCAFVTWILIFSGTFLTVAVILKPWQCPNFFKIVGSLLATMLAGLSSICHIRTMLTDPGSVPKSVIPPRGFHETEETSALNMDSDSIENGAEISKDNNKRWCRRCDAFKPMRAHHCSICGRCIVKMDHHCPWVNNCVGVGNHKLFLLFISYTALLCIVAILLLVYKFILMDEDNLPVQCRSTDSEQMAGMVVGIIAIFFGLFTICMLLDQCNNLETGVTKIDRLKGQVSHGRYQSSNYINEVWGGMDRHFRLHWLCPRPATWPDSEYAILMGFEQDSTETDVIEFGSTTPKHGNPKDEVGSVEMIDFL